MNSEKNEFIKELFKAHFTASEVAAKTGYSYQTIAMHFRVFKAEGVQKYNRYDLIPEEKLNDFCAA